MPANHMTWRAGQQAGGGISNRFPLFQLDGTHLDHGSVHVTARSPTGHIRPLPIEVDSNGQYKTDFVPNEVGDWTMSILYNDQHVEGSPFIVRVQDPTRIRILDMESRGEAGREVTFSVDATGAGEGELTVEVTYQGQVVGSRITRQGSVYCVSFQNAGIGAYHVRVMFEGTDVTGSPFLYNVADHTIVTASGEGLIRGKVGQMSLIRIDALQDADISDIAVIIKSPKGSIYRPHLVPVGPGAFNVEYIPETVGNYVIEVLFYDKPVNGSPFTCHVFDAAQIFVRNLHGRTIVGKSVEFDVDAHESGRGELEIVINDGHVPSKVETRGDRQYHVSFTPTVPIPHFIQIMFNGHEVEGNPWIIEVMSLESIHTTVDTLGCVPINVPATFHVYAQADGDVKVKITNSMRRNTVIPSYVTRHSEGRYDVEFTPTETGKLLIAVTYEDLHVLGSPFNCSVYDGSAVRVSSVDPVAVGELASFTVDATGAGTGELTLVVNDGHVPAEVAQLSKDTYKISFVPTEPGLCHVELCFNGRPIKDSPVVVQVVDPCLIKVESFSHVIPINQIAFIKVDTKAAGPASLVAKVSSPNCRSVGARVKSLNEHEYEIDFIPTELGPHEVSIEYGGQLIPCCPIVLNSYDVSRIRVLGVRDGMVDCLGSFVVDLNKCGEGELDVSVTSARGHPVLNEIKALQPGRLEVSYLPTEAGIHLAEISFNNQQVEGCPFQFNVLDAAKVTTRGDGLKTVECNQLATFVILAPEAQLSDIDVLIQTPNGGELLPHVTQTKPSQFLVEYTPTTAGYHQVEIRYREWPVPGSPFCVQCWDASRVVLANIKQCEVGCDSWFDVELGGAGDGTVEISIAGPMGQLIPNEVVTTSPSFLEVHFVPTVSGVHHATVTYNGSTVPGSPAQFNVIDANRVLVRGEGLGLVQCAKTATFVVSSPDARLNDVDIGIIGPNGIHLVPEIKETSKGNFRVDYVPTHVGNYEICVACFGKEILASPFCARAWDASRVLIADVAKGHVGCPSSFKVHVGDAGEGPVEMTVTDPGGNLIGTEAFPLEPGVFEVVFTPRVAGYHLGNVVFNREKVPGSPFRYLVTDTASVRCYGDGLNLVPIKKHTTFTVAAPQAQLKDVNVRITDPTGIDVLARVLEAGNSTFRVEYTPLLAGTHIVNIGYFEELIPCCPLFVHAWDISKVVVSPFDLAFINCQSQFAVNAQEAGEGKLEAVISGPQCQRVLSDVSTDGCGAFLVSFIPSVSGLHRADLTYNDEQIIGSPLSFTVADPTNVSVSGEGIDSVRCHKPAHFTITSPAAKRNDLDVKITGPNKKMINHKLSESGSGTFTVEYVPPMPGNYEIAVKYFECKVLGSPFTAHAWDPSGVVLRNFGPGCIGTPYVFLLDANKAGRGSLEVTVQCRGETIPNVAHAFDGTTEIEVSFLPKYVDLHHVNIKFNGETVPGSPFAVSIIDGSIVTASGPGLSSSVIAHKQTTFSVSTSTAGGDACLTVYITGPNNSLVEEVMYDGSGASGFNVAYIPREAGTHTVNVRYADISIKGSPFSVDVFDPMAVGLIEEIKPMGRIGKAICVEADTTHAGPGTISGRVKGPTSQPGVTISGSGEGLTALSFVPVEPGRHLLFVLFNNYNIPGSPFMTNVIDSKTLLVNWDELYKRPIGQPIEVLLRTDHSIIHSDFSCSVSDPYGRSLDVAHAATDLTHGFMFIGQDVGPHVIDLKCGSEHVPGSPYTCYVWDIARVRILDAAPCGHVGEEITFIVDTTEAGMGDVDVDVFHGTEGVPIRRQTLRPGQDRFSFVVASPQDHLINVKFNLELLPVSPLVLQITNPAGKMLLTNGNAKSFVPVGENVSGIVSPPGFPVFPRDFLATVTAPNGELIGVNVLPQNDGGIKLEYRSSFTGPHVLDVIYGGQPIPGSPIVTELFDVGKIILEGSRSGRVGETIILDVYRAEAGEAELSININDPQGHIQPFQVDMTEFGETVTYVPERTGIYTVNVVFGGLTVAGCPVRQDIAAVPFASLHGGIVENALVDRLVELAVDVKGEPGELFPEVHGPTALANCNIELGTGGLINVQCIPTEVGVFSVMLYWNGVPVQGTPFKMNVIDPTKVEIVSYSDYWTAPDHLQVQVDKLQSIVFDCRHAGPGKFKATVEGSEGDIGADVLPVGLFEYAVKFVPRKTGDYYIRVYWSGSPIDKFPIIAYASMTVNPVSHDEHLIKPELVRVNGYGITNGRTGELCDFTVDGTTGGPGLLEVQLVGLKCDIEVEIVQLSDFVFGCSYVPELPGAYLLTVLWSGQHVPGSPFKVSVVSGCDASKVVCSGEGLTAGVLDRSASVLIDCKRAGNGAVMAQCNGPTQMAYCTLIDRYDGTFELTINPVEVGQHILEIKYGDEPVPKSPFTIKVTAAPDPNKVLVSGDGINDGLLATYQSSFNVDTRGAGPGQLTVKVRGPKGAFKVEMMKVAGNSRVIACRYHPTEVGQYLVCVLWSGQHVPGSPFVVTIVDSLSELAQIVPRPYSNESLRNMSVFSGNALLYNENYQ